MAAAVVREAGPSCSGSFSSIGGIVVIVWPGVTFLVIAVVWGSTLLVGGHRAQSSPPRCCAATAWGWLVVLGIVETILGILMLAWPDVTVYVILLLIGIYSIVAGILQIVLSFQLQEGARAPRPSSTGGS